MTAEVSVVAQLDILINQDIKNKMRYHFIEVVVDESVQLEMSRVSMYVVME